MSRLRCHVFVCTNQRPDGAPRASCAARGSEALLGALKESAKKRGIRSGVRIQKSGCLDICEHGPAAVVYPKGNWYANLHLEDVEAFISSEVEQGQAYTPKIFESERSAKDPK